MCRAKFIYDLVNELNQKSCYYHYMWLINDFQFTSKLEFISTSCYNCEKCNQRIDEYTFNYPYIYLGVGEEKKSNRDMSSIIDQLDEIRLALNAIQKHLGI